MVGVDAELLERVARWCAEAGRQAGRAEIRRALEPLAWDELLAVRALLADPPPARPLGPHALADIARGATADLAADRERAGRYPSGGSDVEQEVAPAVEPTSRAAAPRPRRRPGGRRAGVVIRRVRDVAPAAVPSPPVPPPLEELHRPEGRAVLERIVRRHGASRAAVVRALAGWRRPDGGPPREEDLAALLEHHGLARAFERRERQELLHALRAAGGVRAVAAARVGVEVAALDAALGRLGAAEDAERIREVRRADLRGRGTLSQRVRLLLSDEERLRDLGLLAEFEQDLRARLPGHLRALRSAAAPLAVALARSLSLTSAEARSVAARFALDLEPPRAAPTPRRAPAPGRRAPAHPAGAPRRQPRGQRRGPR